MTDEELWQALNKVVDPEIPVVTLVEMGIIREAHLEGPDQAVVTITPTFSGCPALYQMKQDIVTRLRALGLEEVNVRVVLSPAWTTDWISPNAREKLRAFGIAPPHQHDGLIDLAVLDQTSCPNCGSSDTELRNSFGPTPCRAIAYCLNCHQPFEQFKPL